MPTFNSPQEALHYHTTGAIERGESVPIVEIPVLRDYPRHVAGDLCYRAILTRDCPFSHEYQQGELSVTEERQLAWLKGVLS